LTIKFTLNTECSRYLCVFLCPSIFNCQRSDSLLSFSYQPSVLQKGRIADG
jgi:hypothetical protein